MVGLLSLIGASAPDIDGIEKIEEAERTASRAMAVMRR